MNERIKELALKAGLISSEYNGFDRNTLTTTEMKFAELIIKETMQIVANNLASNTYIDVAEAVVKHFEESK